MTSPPCSGWIVRGDGVAQAKDFVRGCVVGIEGGARCRQRDDLFALLDVPCCEQAARSSGYAAPTVTLSLSLSESDSAQLRSLATASSSPACSVSAAAARRDAPSPPRAERPGPTRRRKVGRRYEIGTTAAATVHDMYVLSQPPPAVGTCWWIVNLKVSGHVDSVFNTVEAAS